MAKNKTTAEKIRAAKANKPFDIPLKTSQKILARITDGIYRQPASALRELISNAYDADATKVTITTDAPRFGQITVKDNGIGISPAVLEHLIENIGGSAKRTTKGGSLNITQAEDPDFSVNGRKLIGKMGIGLFSVAQFTLHFLIITKCKGDKFRTIADITLGETEPTDPTNESEEIVRGDARVWTEPASNPNASGTEVRLMDLLPRTRAELCSLDHWARIDFEIEQEDKAQTEPPRFHIGRMDKEKPGLLKVKPRLPWEKADKPEARFLKFVNSVRRLAKTDRELVDLDSVCDNYLKTIWDLSLSCPLDFVETHPFDLPKNNKTLFFQLENKTRGQSVEVDLRNGETPREQLDLKSPLRPKNDKFELIVDGIKLSRPIVFTNQPKTANAIKTPLLFVGKCREEFAGKPRSMSGGPLQFEAYIFWTPRVLPKQHQGVMLRIGNATGALFDRTFMNYQISEQNRLRQITAEIFVHEGLDRAINLDRESFNYAHPHYQFLTKWLHSAIRQFTNRHKAVGKAIRDDNRTTASSDAMKTIAKAVSKKLEGVGVDDVVDVEFIDESLLESVDSKREEGIVAFRQDDIFSPTSGKAQGVVRNEINEQKAAALTQLLYGWGLLDDLSHADQAKLVRDILEVVLMGSSR